MQIFEQETNKRWQCSLTLGDGADLSHVSTNSISSQVNLPEDEPGDLLRWMWMENPATDAPLASCSSRPLLFKKTVSRQAASGVHTAQQIKANSELG